MYLLNYDIMQSNKQLLVMQGYVKTCCKSFILKLSLLHASISKGLEQPNPRIWLAKTEVYIVLMRPASWRVLYVANYESCFQK